MTREQILRFALSLPDTRADTPFDDDFDSLVLRHSHSGKWFGLIFKVPCVKLVKPRRFGGGCDCENGEFTLRGNKIDPFDSESENAGKRTLLPKKNTRADGAVLRRAEVINLKCDEEFARLLVTCKDDVFPAYHMNKRLWISIKLDGNMPTDELEEYIRASYTLTSGKTDR